MTGFSVNMAPQWYEKDFSSEIVDHLLNEVDWSDKNESSIMEPYTYITSQPGKDVRTQFIKAFNKWLNVGPEKTKAIAKIVNMLHSASLLIDDIQDNSQLRRGQPVAHKIYGVPQTINTANYVYFLAFQEVNKLRNACTIDDKVESIITSELLNLHRGQGLDLYWRDTLQCPTEEEYVSMVNNKTGGLLRMAVKLMMCTATTNLDVDYVPLVNLIGVYFQIRDDLMNLSSTDYTTNKGFAEDLTEGKFSFPIVHGVWKDTDNRQLYNVLQKRPSTPTLKLHAIKYLKDHTQSFQYTMTVLSCLETKIRMEITRLGGNHDLEVIVDRLHVDPKTME